MLPGNETLSFYPVMNAVRSNLAMNYDIKFLDNSMLILGTDFNTGVNSLKFFEKIKSTGIFVKMQL